MVKLIFHRVPYSQITFIKKKSFQRHQCSQICFLLFLTPFLGLPLVCSGDPNGPRRFSLYRWHLLDSIGFLTDLKVTVQALGWWSGNRRYQPLTDDIASVAYWYQIEPHVEFPNFPALKDRWSR